MDGKPRTGMKYLYDTHVHTSAASKCGHVTPEEMADLYKAEGFTGIFITDHFYVGNTCVDRKLPWKDWVHGFCDAYRRAKKRGDEIGLQVFFGWESTYDDADLLVYGLSEEWLYAHPEIIRMNEREQYAAVKAAGGMVVHAHPFRERPHNHQIRLSPYWMDAVEIANACNYPYEDRAAYDYAKEYDMAFTGGSDLHRYCATVTGELFGIETDEKLTSEKDYIRLILSRTGYRLHIPENHFAVKRKNPFLPVYFYDENGMETPLDLSDPNRETVTEIKTSEKRDIHTKELRDK